MKKLIVLLFLATTLFAQVKIDSATVIISDNVSKLYGRATFTETPSANDYDIGFLFGESYNELNYIPMGGYVWNDSLKQLTYWTEITNLDINSKHFYTPFIQPKAQIRKFAVDSEGEKEDIVCEPVIESASGTLSGQVGETLTFSVTMESREESCSYNYQWSYKLATESEVYDTISIEPLEIDTDRKSVV